MTSKQARNDPSMHILDKNSLVCFQWDPNQSTITRTNTGTHCL